MAQFSNHDARRIARTVRAYESGHKPQQRATAPRFPGGSKVFVVTTQITAGNGADTPGKGKGTMQVFDPATGKFTATDYTNIDIYNEGGVSIKVGAYVQCVVLDGCWFYDVTNCLNGA